MDKITEEVLTSLIKRIELLEEKVREKTPKKVFTPGHKGGVTPGQIDFIIGLGGNIWEGMTSREASEYIDELKSNKNHLRKQTGVETTVARNAHECPPQGMSTEKGVLDNPEETGPLTKEQIEELGEGAFL